MAPKPHTQVITARVLVEVGSESLERTSSYVIQALKSSCRNIRSGSVVIGVYDEEDNLVGMDMTGTPSETFQDLVDEMFDLPTEDEGVLPPAPFTPRPGPPNGTTSSGQ